MAVTNLFSSLAKWKDVAENFATAGLAWLIRHDRPVRTAFFDACRSALGANGRGRGSWQMDVIAKLEAATPIEARTQHGIFPDGASSTRCVYPDIQLGDPAYDVCCFVEVKLWARPTHHLIPAHHRARTRDRDVTAPRDVVVQTKTYRRWLDRHYRRRGILLALTVDSEPDLVDDCDGWITWDQLGRGLRRHERDLSAIAREFCSFLEGEGMMKSIAHPVTMRDAKALTTASPLAWSKWEMLLNAISHALKSALTETSSKCKARTEERDLGVRREPGETALWLWTTWVIGSGRGYFEISPYVVCNRDTSGIALSVWSRPLRRLELSELKRLVPKVRVEPDGDERLFFLRPLPKTFFEKNTLDSQATAMVALAMKDVVTPLLRVL